jgi:subtilisin-like proprotein convertase family protein
MAAGIIALALEANPDLTWRDVQHIIVRTSKPLNLKAPDWMENAMGRMVSHSYGYGLMDAAEMGQAAKRWKTVPKQESCVVSSPYYEKMIPAMGYVTVEIDVKECPSIRHLEHVVIPTYVTAGRKRGDLRIYLQSPSGTRSTLLDARPQDYSSAGFVDWPFMSVHHWGENPTGTWILEVHNDAFSEWASEAKFHKWSLELYGIKYDPNSEEYADERFNVVREANLETEAQPRLRNFTSAKVEQVSISTPVKAANSTSPERRVVVDRGCVSKQIHCTKNITDCRTFTHRPVADVFCKCTPPCLEVASLSAEIYNMQCDMNVEPEKSAPFFCQFIPFFSY